LGPSGFAGAPRPMPAVIVRRALAQTAKRPNGSHLRLIDHYAYLWR
jgi:hypothetical protein